MNIFISYAWADLTQSLLPKFLNVLEPNYTVWFDQEQLHAGDLIRPKLKEALLNADVVVYLYTETSAKRPDCQYELATAIKYKKIIIPCLLDEYALKNPRYHSQLPKEAVGLGISFIGEQVKGVLAFDDGMSRFESRLLRLEVELFNRAHRSNESADLLIQIEEIDKLLGRLQTIRYRQQKGVSGNADAEAACEMCLRLAEKIQLREAQLKGTPEAYKMAEFTIQMRQINATSGSDDFGKKKALLQALRRIDPSGTVPALHVMRQALERIIGNDTQSSVSQTNPSPELVSSIDLVAARLRTIKQQVMAAQQHDQQNQWLRYYLERSFGKQGLDERASFAWQFIDFVPKMLSWAWEEAQQSQLAAEFQPFLNELMNYFEKSDDYLPDEYGLYGLLDDAFLATRTLEELNRSFRERFGKPLVSIDLTAQNQYIAGLLGPNLSNRINADVSARIPQLQRKNESNWQALGLLAVVGLGIFQAVQHQQKQQAMENERWQLLSHAIYG